MLLAELTVRHTRRHMPTRRVALDHAYLPTSGGGHGIPWSRRSSPSTSRTRRGAARAAASAARPSAQRLTIPRIALRHRLQHDVHGLDRSRHRVLGEDGHLVVELDRHGAATPQVLGAVMAAAALPSRVAGAVLDAIRRVVNGRWAGLAAGVELRDCYDRELARAAAPRGHGWEGRRPEEELWQGVPRRSGGPWRCSACGSGWTLERDDISRRFRRLLRDAHPDRGGARGAGGRWRIAELSEARAMLLGRGFGRRRGPGLASALRTDDAGDEHM